MDKIAPLFKEFKELIEDDDTEALAILEKLRPLIAGDELPGILNSVEDALNDYDFEEALEHMQRVDALLDR
jgi:hypothetical protein